MDTYSVNASANDQHQSLPQVADMPAGIDYLPGERVIVYRAHYYNDALTNFGRYIRNGTTIHLSGRLLPYEVQKCLNAFKPFLGINDDDYRQCFIDALEAI